MKMTWIEAHAKFNRDYNWRFERNRGLFQEWCKRNGIELVGKCDVLFI